MYRPFVTALFAGLASAQSLTALLGDTPELSSLTTILESYPTIAESLASTPNLTIFAPNNAAIRAIQSTLSNATDALVSAILSYHVVGEVIMSKDITEVPAFAPTTLTSRAYTTVTGGQVVEAAVIDGDVILTSGSVLAIFYF